MHVYTDQLLYTRSYSIRRHTRKQRAFGLGSKQRLCSCWCLATPCTLRHMLASTTQRRGLSLVLSLGSAGRAETSSSSSSNVEDSPDDDVDDPCCPTNVQNYATSAHIHGTCVKTQNCTRNPCMTWKDRYKSSVEKTRRCPARIRSASETQT